MFRGQWPILLVGLFFLAAFGLVIAGYWRRGALVLGIGVAVAAALRLALTDDRAGLLVVRSKGIDLVHHCDGQCCRALHRRDDRPVGHELDSACQAMLPAVQFSVQVARRQPLHRPGRIEWTSSPRAYLVR